MKTPQNPWLPCMAAAALSVSHLLAQPASGNSLHEVEFQLGKSEFAPGDSITILHLRGTSDTIKIGETYVAEGTYELTSQEEADLALYTTTIAASGPTPVDPRQHVKVRKGSGSFHLVETVTQDGYLHISFYPVKSGSGFGGVYFGQGDRVLRAWSQTSSALLIGSGPNQRLLEYLGNPVAPPVNLDARYTQEGLTNALQTAAQNAGITLKKVVVDDTEFPCVTGVFCAGSDFSKLKAQIRKLDGYDYSGSIGNDVNRDGSDTCNVFSLVPYHAYPEGTFQAIYHRLWLREQVFHDQLNGRK